MRYLGCVEPGNTVKLLTDNIKQINRVLALLTNLRRLLHQRLVQHLQLPAVLLVEARLVLELAQLVAKALAVRVELREHRMQRADLLRVGLQDGAEEDVQVVEGGLRLLYATHLHVFLLRILDLLGGQVVLFALLDEHVRPTGDR